MIRHLPRVLVLYITLILHINTGYGQVTRGTGGILYVRGDPLIEGNLLPDVDFWTPFYGGFPSGEITGEVKLANPYNALGGLSSNHTDKWCLMTRDDSKKKPDVTIY